MLASDTDKSHDALLHILRRQLDGFLQRTSAEIRQHANATTGQYERIQSTLQQVLQSTSVANSEMRRRSSISLQEAVNGEVYTA
jgi:hypothetical protein